MRWNLVLAVMFCVVQALTLSGQPTDKKVSYHALISPSFSYGGLNTEIGVTREQGAHRIGLAYRAILSESRFFGRAEHGLSLRYSGRLIDNGKLSASLIGRVMQAFGTGGDRQGEYLIGQELSWTWTPNIHVDFSLAAGMYEETVKNNRFGVVTNDFGASGLVGLGLRYVFKRSGE